MAEPVTSSAPAQTPSSVTPRAPNSPTLWAFVVVALALMAEATLLYAALREATVPSVLLAHLAIVAVMIGCLQHHVRACTDGGYAVLAIVATLATGPFGALGALLMPRLARRNPASEALLSAWYARIALSAEQDAFTKLSDRVAIGRAANLAALPPEPFVELFQTGPIAEQQIALGLIARSFHVGYLPVLQIALDSPEPVIRVQAAAVAARIRGPLNAGTVAQFARAADPTLTPAEAMEVAVELRAAIESRLLDSAEQTTAERVREALLARIFARLDARQRKIAAGERVSPELTGDDVDDAYASHLLANGRYADFRAHRLAMRRPFSGRYRRRRVRSRPISAHGVRQLRPLAVRA